jgi:hypothetical protein
MRALQLIGGSLLLVIIVAAIFGLVTAWAWNTVMPQVFGLPSIDIVQGFALNLLGGALFKSNHISASRS